VEPGSASKKWKPWEGGIGMGERLRRKMKKLVYRDMRGNNPNKHEVSVEEVCEWPDTQIGFSSDSRVSRKKIYKCFVKEMYVSKKSQDLRDWVCSKKEEKCQKNCHILRQIDTKTGENKIICKVLGDFFIIYGDTAYQIVFVNEIRIQVK